MARHQFNCKVQIEDIKENIPLYFKVDGDRFQYPYTVKMLTNSIFRFVIQFRPVESEIQSIMVDGANVSFNVSKSNDSNWMVEFLWYSESKATMKRNGRKIIPIMICFGNVNFIVFDLQVKYYANKNSAHISWGRLLSHVQFDVLAEVGPRKPTEFQYKVKQVKMH